MSSSYKQRKTKTISLTFEQKGVTIKLNVN